MRSAVVGAQIAFTLLFSSGAYAECSRPDIEVKIPEGTSATEDEIVAARRKLLVLEQELSTFLSCLQGEASQNSIGKDEATRKQMAAELASSQSTAIEGMAVLAACFNAQLDSFQKSGGGAGSKPADCSVFSENALEQLTRNTSADSGWIREADGHSFELAGGTWSFSLLRDDVARACGEQNPQQCLERRVYVLNGSDQALECKGEIKYAGTDIAGQPTTQSQALVPARSGRALVSSLAPRDVSAETFDAQCTPRKPLAPLDTPADCKYEVVQPVAISDYYPPTSRHAGEEGPVIVEFTLRGKAGNPRDVRVVASSLFPKLDEAAAKAVADMVMSSSCKQARYRLQLSFQLQE